MLLAILQVSSGCYTVVIAQSSKSGCSWGNFEWLPQCTAPTRTISWQTPGCVSHLSCLQGWLELNQYSFAWVRKEGHMLERAADPRACGWMCWQAEWPGTEEKIPHTSSVCLAKPQLGTFGTHGHRGTAPRHGSVKSGCGFSPQSMVSTCPKMPELDTALFTSNAAGCIPAPTQACLLFTGYGWTTGRPQGPAGPFSRDRTNHKRHPSCWGQRQPRCSGGRSSAASASTAGSSRSRRTGARPGKTTPGT